MATPIEMLFDDPGTVWSDKHKAVLRVMWAKFTKGTSMWNFNRKFHSGLLREMTTARLHYIIEQDIPHYSTFAAEVLAERQGA